MNTQGPECPDERPPCADFRGIGNSPDSTAAYRPAFGIATIGFVPGGLNMPRVDRIERRIAELEGFEVRIVRGGVDVRGNMEIPVHYPMYSRRANDSATVAEWKAARFRPTFVGLDVEVLSASGEAVHGLTALRTVRASYLR